MAVLGTQAIATLIAVYGLFMTPLGWGWAGFVWLRASLGPRERPLEAGGVLDSGPTRQESRDPARGAAEARGQGRPHAGKSRGGCNVKYVNRFRVHPGDEVRLKDVDPGFKDHHESHKKAAEEIDRDRESCGRYRRGCTPTGTPRSSSACKGWTRAARTGQ